MEEIKELDLQHAFKIFNGFTQETKGEKPTPEQVDANRREKLQKQDEARQRAKAKKRKWEETFGASSQSRPSSPSFGSSVPPSQPSQPSSQPQPAEFHDIRLSFVFEHLVDQLNKFFQTHDVYARSQSQQDESSPLRAKIVSVSINSSSLTPDASLHSTSALSLWVQPPIELFEEPYCCSHPQGSIPSRMNLAMFMNTITTVGSKRRMYEDVQCLIEWKKTSKGRQPVTSSLSLSTLIPTTILFATDMARVDRYTKYLSWLSADPLVITLFQSPEFHQLFAIPFSLSTLSSLSSVGPMEIEVEDVEVKVNEIVRMSGFGFGAKEKDDREPVGPEPIKPRPTPKRRQRREIVVSMRKLRPRQLCNCKCKK